MVLTLAFQILTEKEEWLYLQSNENGFKNHSIEIYDKKLMCKEKWMIISKEISCIEDQKAILNYPT